MWTTNVSLTNNTDYSITVLKNHTSEITISPNGGTSNWVTSDSPNVDSFKFWKPTDQGNVYPTFYLLFGIDKGVCIDKGATNIQSVIMDIDVNGYSVIRNVYIGEVIVQDFSSGGNLSIVFRNDI